MQSRGVADLGCNLFECDVVESSGWVYIDGRAVLRDRWGCGASPKYNFRAATASWFRRESFFVPIFDFASSST